MQILKPLTNITFLCCLCVISFCSVAKEPKEVYWEDLVPTNEQSVSSSPLPLAGINHGSSMTQTQPNAPLVESLNQQYVKIPGFIVPLEGSSNLTTEFLLVPYFGACVHAPPPPSNQIVHVVFDEGVKIENLYDAIWVTGIISTKGWKGDIAVAGYTMSGVQVSAF